MIVVEPAPAKLNLALHVRSRRADGFHELDTLFAFVTDGDVLTVARAPRWSLTITGPFADDLSSGPENLVTRAATAFAERFGGGTGYAVYLEKVLPIASGIGGGSADAAAMLRALARLNGVVTDEPALLDCAAKLGSDVPACLLGTTARGGGRGEQLTQVDGLAGRPVLLVNPGVAVATGSVFGGWDGIDRGPLPEGDAARIARDGRNDLQPSALPLAPVITEVLAALDDAAVARMSGSGATCFGLYRDVAARDAAVERIGASRLDWWLLPTTLA